MAFNSDCNGTRKWRDEDDQWASRTPHRSPAASNHSPETIDVIINPLNPLNSIQSHHFWWLLRRSSINFISLMITHKSVRLSPADFCSQFGYLIFFFACSKFELINSITFRDVKRGWRRVNWPVSNPDIQTATWHLFSWIKSIHPFNSS